MNKHHNLGISIIAVSTLVFIVTLLSITGTRAAQELPGAPSADGDLDPTFGSGGIASAPFHEREHGRGQLFRGGNRRYWAGFPTEGAFGSDAAYHALLRSIWQTHNNWSGNGRLGSR